MIETGLETYLAADTAVAALVGTRIYAIDDVPQDRVAGARPYITHQRISSPKLVTMDGADGLANPRIQLNCVADTYLGAMTLADKVRLALDGYSGAMGSQTVQAAFVDDARALGEELPTGKEQGIYAVAVDVEIWWNETAPSF